MPTQPKADPPQLVQSLAVEPFDSKERLDAVYDSSDCVGSWSFLTGLTGAPRFSPRTDLCEPDSPIPFARLTGARCHDKNDKPRS